MHHQTDDEHRQRLLAALVERESGVRRELLSDADEATLASLQAELDTLVSELRQPQHAREPGIEFEEESGCRRAIELVETLGQPADGDSSEATPPRPGGDAVVYQRLGPYEVTGKLGEGGMGAVYKAVHPKLKRTVAIKVLPARRLKDTAAIARFEREMAAIGVLNHPNIVTAHDAGEDGGMHYLVMEYVEGFDLSALVRRVGPLAPADACEIAAQVARGLAEAAARGVIHRDIKPSNVMLGAAPAEGASATVKILDFGLAQLSSLHGDPGELTTSGQIMGTLKYMAPEQCSQSHAVDARVDIYSLGATLYKLLCGVSPFSDERFDSPLALLAALGREEPPRLVMRRHDVPPKLEAIVHRMLAKKPADRFASPGEVIDALAPWTDGADLAALLTQAQAETAPSQAAAFDRGRPLGPPSAPAAGSADARSRRLSPPVILLGGALLLAAGLLSIPKLRDDQRNSSSDPPTSDAAQRLGDINNPSQRSRDVAEWLVSRAAEIEISTAGGCFATLQPGEKLPDDFLQLLTTNLDENKELSDDDLARFDRLPLFTSLSIGRTKIGDAGLGQLGQLPLLQMLFVSETAVSDAGLEQLERYPKLEVLHLHGTQVTDAGLPHLAGHVMLYDLSLGGCSVTDDGLTHLTGLKRLQILALNRTGVTPRGIATIQQSLPDCEIRSDYSQEEIAAAREAIPKVLTQPEDR